MTDLLSLISKLEAATGPSRELDCEIALAVGWGSEDQRAELRKYTDHASRIFVAREIGVPRYTGSLDAALTLVPDGRPWSIGTILHGGGYVSCLDRQAKTSKGATAPLALVIASLKALHHSKTTEEAA